MSDAISNEPAPEGTASEKTRDIFIDLININLPRLFSVLKYTWENHKIIASIFYPLVALFPVLVGLGGISYYRLQLDAAKYHHIKDEFDKMQDWKVERVQKEKEIAVLESRIALLEATNINYDSIISLASEIEGNLSAAAHGIASVIFGSADIHDPEILLNDEKSWDALIEFSDFYLKFRASIAGSATLYTLHLSN